jgi:ferric-dicitrate binding protein FerR (iron transport regulator)
VKMGDGSMIEVVGTKFNCTAYEEDHHTTTTLLEGKVKLIATDPARVNERPLILQPGQQAEKAIGATGFQVKAVDASMAVSWVQGSFYFDRVPLSLVFKQLERWYDVQFEYDATVINSAGNFKGSFERNIPLSGVLNKLEFVSNIRFTLNGKKVKVLAP